MLMAEPVVDGTGMRDVILVILGILGLAVTVISGFVKFLYSRIGDVEKAQTTINSDLRDEMRNFVGELRQSMAVQVSDHRLAQNNLWTEMRRIADRNSDEHTRVAEKIGQLATRDEVLKAVEASEARLMVALRKEIPQR